MRFIAFLLLLLLWACTAHAEIYTPFTVTGQVVKNHDGDTIKLQTNDRGLLVIRFAASDTPETGQAYWKVARGVLRSQVDGKLVTVPCYKKDGRERDVCRVFVGSLDIGLETVRRGVAWYAYHFGRELTESEQRDYQAAERLARELRLVLWADLDPMPPWECRKLRRAGQKCR